MFYLVFTACTDYKKETLKYHNDASYVYSFSKRGDFYSAKSEARKLIESYSDRAEPYFIYALLLTAHIQDNFSVEMLSESDKKAIEEAIKLARSGIDKFEMLSEEQQKIVFENGGYQGIYGHALLLTEYQQYGAAIEVYKKYCKVDEFIYHPVFRYCITGYADALAKHGQLKEGVTMYEKAFQANGNDLVMLQPYIHFIADYGSHERAIKFATNYMKEKGKSAQIQFTLCEIFEEIGNKQSVVNCYRELLG